MIPVSNLHIKTGYGDTAAHKVLFLEPQSSAVSRHTIQMFLLLLLLLTSSTTGEWFNRFLRFPSTLSVENYVLASRDMANFQTAFTICAWVKPWHTGNSYGVWFSYQAAATDDNEIGISDNPSSWNKIFIVDVGGSTLLEKGSWTHQCLVWDFASLTVRSYVDGQEAASKATAAGRTLNTGGTIVLGQDQDTRRGSFDPNQAFGGELYQLNMWSRALEAEEIAGMAGDGLCGSLEPEIAEDIVLPWQNFLDATRLICLLL